jgi:hypothetical protein
MWLAALMAASIHVARVSRENRSAGPEISSAATTRPS